MAEEVPSPGRQLIDLLDAISEEDGDDYQLTMERERERKLKRVRPAQKAMEPPLKKRRHMPPDQLPPVKLFTMEKYTLRSAVMVTPLAQRIDLWCDGIRMGIITVTLVGRCWCVCMHREMGDDPECSVAPSVPFLVDRFDIFAYAGTRPSIESYASTRSAFQAANRGRIPDPREAAVFFSIASYMRRGEDITAVTGIEVGELQDWMSRNAWNLANM
jgi:hypothetical protein